MSMFSPDEIISEIEKEPELFQAEVAARYKGLVVDCVLAIGQRLPNNDGTATIHFMFPDPKRFLRFVSVRVNPNEVPSVKFDPDGTLYRVSGKILEASRWSISLEDAKIERNSVVQAASTGIEGKHLSGSLAQRKSPTDIASDPTGTLKKLLDWNRKNHPWFFSGLGVFVLSSIFAVIYWSVAHTSSDGKLTSPTPLARDLTPTPLSPSPQAPKAATVPLASPSVAPKLLGLSLEQYNDKLESFGSRWAPKSDYIEGVRNSRVVWQGVVFNVQYRDPTRSFSFDLVTLRSEKDPQKHLTTSVEFINPGPSLHDRIRALESGDLIEVSGTLYDGRPPDVILDASDFTLLRVHATPEH